YVDLAVSVEVGILVPVRTGRCAAERIGQVRQVGDADPVVAVDVAGKQGRMDARHVPVGGVHRQVLCQPLAALDVEGEALARNPGEAEGAVGGERGSLDEVVAAIVRSEGEGERLSQVLAALEGDGP